MDDATAAHVFQVAVKVAKAMKETLGCEGLNIVQNNGEIAGQTVFHFHMHIIPRYKGDTVNIGWTPGKADADEINELKEKLQQVCKVLHKKDFDSKIIDMKLSTDRKEVEND